jgi:glycosyltransferase involved in cell wall biosynthesis
MRITFVSHSAELYGAELCLHELAANLVANGDHELELICPTEGPLLELFADLGVPTHVIEYGRWATPRASPRRKLRLLKTNLRAVGRLARHFRAHRPDVVVTSTITVPSAAVASRLVGIPHLQYALEFGAEQHNVFFHAGRSLSLRVLGALSTIVIATSEALARDLGRHINTAKLRVVYYAADIDPVPTRPPADPEAPLRIAMLGYMTPGKGQDQAVRAVGALRTRGVDASLSLVGPGMPAYVESLAELSRDLDVADRVHLIGFVGEDRFSYFAKADVALSCSELEGLPRVVVEAMKCGASVVGTRSGGTTELITEGWNGYLFEPRDVAELSDKLEQLAQDRPATARMGRNAEEWARIRFTPERYAADFLAAATDARRGRR